MPGPMLTATIGEAMRRGWSAGLLISVGHALLEMMVLCLAVWGLGRFLEHRVVFSLLGLAGGSVLCWMGLDMIRKINTTLGELDEMSRNAKPDYRGPIRVGILTSISNPYFTLWWATIGLNYAANAMTKGWAGLGSFYLGHISSDFVWFTFVAFMVASGRRWMSPRIIKSILIVCGLLLVLLGVWFVYSGIHVWF